MRARESFLWMMFCVCGIVSLLLWVLNLQHHHPVYIWDEAIYAQNAQWMSHTHRFFPYLCNGLPDMYNSKPPLVLWLQALCLAVWNGNVWALRIPSFIALVGIGLLYYVYGQKWKLPVISRLLAFFFLLTFPGAIRPHVFLSGDLDAMLIFFTTGMYLQVMHLTFFVYPHTKQADTMRAGMQQHPVPSKNLWIFFLFFMGAYFCKSTAVLLMLPSCILLVVWNGAWRWLIRSRMLWLAGSLTLVLIIVYYWLREQTEPGYWHTVWFSEFNRYWTSVMDWHNQPFSFYFYNLWKRFATWQILLTLILGKICLRRNTIPFTHLGGSLLAGGGIFLLIISLPATKLEWYDAPLYPLWALALGLLYYGVKDRLLQQNQSYFPRLIIHISAAVLLTSFAWLISGQSAETVSQIAPQEMAGDLLQKMDAAHPQSAYHVLMEGEPQKEHHYDAFYFYKWRYQWYKHTDVQLVKQLTEVKPGDHLLVTNAYALQHLITKYYCQRPYADIPQFLLIGSEK